MKMKKSTIALFLGPALGLFLIFILYPILRTIVMSFFKVNTITSPIKEWEFVGLTNYTDLLANPLFKASAMNLLKIWFFSGIFTIGIALVFAAILNSNIIGKRFFTSIVYLPQVISVIAIGYAWLLYVFNRQYGMLTTFFDALGLEKLANIEWTSSEMILTSMIIAATFGGIGGFTLMFLSAMSNIPQDYYNVARIAGQNAIQQFFTITLPLITNVIRTSVVLFTTATIGFFAFARVFSDVSTVTPMLFTYQQIFGTEINADTNVGIGAASGVMMTIVGLILFIISNYVFKEIMSIKRG
ncbi:ABC-type sugar transport system permease subunit [Staphylococcus auricularis]|uniref:Sugar ABC transporter permease n=2 Tax=Staphylococcus auricularis TaxID=29379 RepID=A0AAP8PNR1_9STAP|nr:sugar ABC transporter permease [Staphylococcus auricularis]QPT06164.1 sugar ABC transporter permease [Staphylococcus auricularis]BCU51298.1 sugar ABC transporter permease [Staphylococcus auricularis]SQJ06251.1 sn-glycerol-3-phosphate transport system permease protein ugpA [Staphylococcus auricularis]